MKRLACIVSIFALFIGCSIIDDDLSVCGQDYVITYELKLVTDLKLSLEEKLKLDIEQQMSDTLREWLGPIFSGRAHDLDMSFFSLDVHDQLRHHWKEVIDTTQKSFTLYIPREDYMHIAVVNLDENGNVSITGGQHASTMRLEQRKADILNTQMTAVYAAREPMLMAQDTTIEQFDVHLYMVNCVVALVIDTIEADVVDMDVQLSGTATGFSVLDSTFLFDHSTIIRAHRLMNKCYAAVTWPSRLDTTQTGPSHIKAARQDDETSLWELCAYAKLANGTTTATRLKMFKPLKAGTLEIIRVNLGSDGSLEPLDFDSHEMGVSVQLDWNSGNDHNIFI